MDKKKQALNEFYRLSGQKIEESFHDVDGTPIGVDHNHMPIKEESQKLKVSVISNSDDDVKEYTATIDKGLYGSTSYDELKDLLLNKLDLSPDWFAIDDIEPINEDLNEGTREDTIASINMLVSHLYNADQSLNSDKAFDILSKNPSLVNLLPLSPEDVDSLKHLSTVFKDNETNEKLQKILNIVKSYVNNEE